MRIVIDAQGAQTSGSAFRGIGRYTVALAQGIARLRDHHDVIIAVNDAFPESIPRLREAFAAFLPAENFRVWQCPRNINASEEAKHSRRAAAELIREAYLAELRPDIILISSLFEGFGDDSVATVGILHGIPTAVILYDLIPYIYRRTYLTPNPAVEAWYEAQLSHLRRADLLLAISGSSAREVEDYLGFLPDQVENISTAADPKFRRQSFPQPIMDAVLAKYGLSQPFVMYTGGIDHRKNIEGLITAFSKLPVRLRQDYQLAVVCKADDAAQSRLKALAKQAGLRDVDFVLTGFVSETDLVVLYHACSTFVFPSWHEGFGLPALEAMACGAPVIASNRSSLPEVIGLPDALFDPMDTGAIAAKLQQVLDNTDFRQSLVDHGLQQASQFSWDITARRALDALEKLHMRRSPSEAKISQCIPRPRLAYVSPLPPEKSGISDYSTQLLPELGRFYDITIIVDQVTVQPEWLHTHFTVRSSEWLRANPEHFDRVLFHFGNSSFHKHMFDLLDEVQGVVVLHDFFLSGVVGWMEGRTEHPAPLARALYQSHGYAAVEQRFTNSDTNSVIWEFPCNVDVLKNALGVIVHSQNSLRLAEHWYGPDISREWSIIPLLRTPALQNHRGNVRKKLGIPEDAILVCSFGMLGPTKLSHVLLEAWLTSELSLNPNMYLIFVGENHDTDYGRSLNATIKSSRIEQRIYITGWADPADYHDYLTAADIAVQLRALSRGETSAAVLDCMNYGIATIVNAHGSMADLADDTVWKLPDLFDLGELVHTLETMVRNPDQRAMLGQRARKCILSLHAPRVCAEKYYEAIETAYRISDISTRGAIGRMPLSLTNTDLGQIAVCLAQNQIQRTPFQLLLDISDLVVNERIKLSSAEVQENLLKLLREPPMGYRIEPIYASVKGYRYARKLTMNFLKVSEEGFEDSIVEARAGDIFVALGPLAESLITQTAVIQQWQCLGVRTYFWPRDPQLGEELENKKVLNNFSAGSKEVAVQLNAFLCSMIDNA